MNSEINNNKCNVLLNLTDSKDYKKYLDLTNSKEYIELYNYYQKSTFMDILGVSRQENPHSSFWRWLLDSSSNHEIGDFPLRKFIETVCFTYVKLYSSKGLENDPWFCNKKEDLNGRKYNLFNKENYKILSQVQNLV